MPCVALLIQITSYLFDAPYIASLHVNVNWRVYLEVYRQFYNIYDRTTRDEWLKKMKWAKRRINKVSVSWLGARWSNKRLTKIKVKDKSCHDRMCIFRINLAFKCTKRRERIFPTFSNMLQNVNTCCEYNACESNPYNVLSFSCFGYFSICWRERKKGRQQNKTWHQLRFGSDVVFRRMFACILCVDTVATINTDWYLHFACTTNVSVL